MKKQYQITGLDCANCALKVSNHIGKHEDVEKVSIDFLNQRLFITYKGDELSVDQLLKIAAEVEKDPLVITEFNQQKKKKTAILTKDVIVKIIRILISAVLLLTGVLLVKLIEPSTLISVVSTGLFVISYLIVSYDVLWKAVKNIISLRNIFDETVLMTIATIGAFIIASYEEAVLVMLLFQIGEVFEALSVAKSKRTIMATLELRQTTAHKIVDGKVIDVDPEALQVDETIIVKVGEVVPVDGVVIEGIGALDTSSITGEFMPQGVVVGDIALSGTIVHSGSLILRVRETYQNSTVAKIIELITSSGDKKAKSEKFIAKFSRVYTPIVILISLLIAVIPPLFNGQWDQYIYIGLTLLVISCPCAIVISVPLTFFTGLGLASKHGIIVKGAEYLDRLGEIRKLVYDKTGTLTYGQFKVTEVYFDEEKHPDFIAILATAESLSIHPIATAITKMYEPGDVKRITHFNERPGLGIEAQFDGVFIQIGGEKLFENQELTLPKPQVNGVTIYVRKANEIIGYVTLSDEIKRNVPVMIEKLKAQNIEVVMLTGDKSANAADVAKQLQINSFHAGLMPGDKTVLVEKLIEENKGAVGFIGDGVNDAPTIRRADVGIAMGGIGSDVTVENADVVIMNDDPFKILTAIEISKKTRQRAIFNIVFALLIKVVVMVLAFFNLAPMWLAVLSDTGLAVLLIIHSVMLIRYKPKTSLSHH